MTLMMSPRDSLTERGRREPDLALRARSSTEPVTIELSGQAAELPAQDVSDTFILAGKLLGGSRCGM
jgi:hypothetical protein